MALRFYGHPLSSYCWKALIALYEVEVEFDYERLDDLAEPGVAARFRAVSPFGKMPAVEDTEHGVIVTESSIVVEYVAPGLVPKGGAAEREVRLWDRTFDLYVMNSMQQIVGDRLRPVGRRDPFGCEQARATLRTAYAVLEPRLAGREWIAGDFSMADCAAAPALYYAQKVEPFDPGHPNIAAYLARLSARSSFARVLTEAQPYLHMFPQEPKD